MVRLVVLFVCTIKIFFLIQNIEATREYDSYFHIFTKDNPDKPISMIWTDIKKWSTVKNYQTCSIKLIAHGYAERWNMDWRWDWVAEMKDEMLNNKKTKENYCVIAVDWEKGAREVNFITAVANSDIAGLHVAEFMLNNNIDPKRLHCIGFSLGAHLCAFASNNYYTITKNTAKFGRVTGLDPSGPLLRKASIDKRLSQDDADFVDCIHTSKVFGLQEKSGHMDFFPDGGDSNAEGCEKFIEIKDDDDDNNNNEKSKRHIIFKRFLFHRHNNETDDGLPKKSFIERIRDQIGKITALKKVFLNVHSYIGCNHLRSPHYFISSINQCPFRAKLCTSWLDYIGNKCKDPIDNDSTYPRMGFYADQSDKIYKIGNGSYYLKTTADKPYCSPLPVTKQKSKKQTGIKSKIRNKITKLLPKRNG